MAYGRSNLKGRVQRYWCLNVSNVSPFWKRMTLKNSQITPERRKVKWHVHACGNDANAFSKISIWIRQVLLSTFTHSRKILSQSLLFFFTTPYVFYTWYLHKVCQAINRFKRIISERNSCFPNLWILTFIDESCFQFCFIKKARLFRYTFPRITLSQDLR